MPAPSTHRLVDHDPVHETAPHPAGAAAPSTNRENGPTAESAGPSANGSNGRDARGRFAPGNSGGPGNPYARKVAALRRALVEAVTEDDIRAVAQKLLEQAKQGDVAAARLLFAYTIGRPTEAVDPDTLNQKEWQILRQSNVPGDEVGGIFQRMPLDLACMVTRAALPEVSKSLAGPLAQALWPYPGEPGSAGKPGAKDQRRQKTAARRK